RAGHGRRGLPRRDPGPPGEPRARAGDPPPRRAHRAARGRPRHAHRVARGRGAASERPGRRRLREHRPGGRPVIARYTGPDMAAVWSDEARLARWLDVELAVVDELAARGEVPAAAARALRRDARVNVARMQEIEAEVHHDMIAFVSSVAEALGDESRFLHLGLTSSDVVDTAFAMQLRDAA